MMQVLADTNIWCEYFRRGMKPLTDLVTYDFITMHPLVIGELAVGNLPDRAQTIADLQQLPGIQQASYQETHLLLETHQLWGSGLQWNDLLILASVITTPGTLLWTLDKRLASAADQFSIGYTPT